MTFTAPGGQQVGLTTQTSLECRSVVTVLLGPDGARLASVCGRGTIEPRTLPVDGTYTVVVDPDGPTTGEVAVTLRQA